MNDLKISQNKTFQTDKTPELICRKSCKSLQELQIYNGAIYIWFQVAG